MFKDLKIYTLHLFKNAQKLDFNNYIIIEEEKWVKHI